MRNLSIGLICHHGNKYDYDGDCEVTKRVSIEGNVPITYFFSGIELNAIANDRKDISGAIKHDGKFINPRAGNIDSSKSELAIMPFNHIPLVHPHGQGILSTYFREILEPQVRWSQGIAENEFGITPVTIHPPDGVYAPAAAHNLKRLGLDNVVISGEFLGDNKHAKGLMYWASGLRHVMRTNDIQPQNPQFWNAKNFIDAVESYCQENNINNLLVTCDIDEFTGKLINDNGMSLDDGVNRLNAIGAEAYGRVNLVNVNTLAHWYNPENQTDLENIWGWNYVSSQIGDGTLKFIDDHKNGEIGHVIWLIGKRRKENQRGEWWDEGAINNARDCLCMAADIACRYDRDPYGLEGFYRENIGKARHLLQG